ncbi:MAG: family 10 glycosylhydrolase [Crocinitomicaceae bacterium]
MKTIPFNLNTRLYFLLLFAILDFPIFGQGAIISLDVTNNIVQPKAYVVTTSSQTIKVDGKASEKAWANAPWTDYFMDIEGDKIPTYNTRVKMLWDSIYLYIYAEIEEPHIWGDITERDATMYYNNDFEVFIDPSGDTRNYGEIEVNAKNAVWDLLLSKPYRSGGKYNTQWDIPGIRTAVHIDGTLNNPKDEDKGWQLEMAIPLQPFVMLKNKPRSYPVDGEQWRINFSRVNWDYELVNGKYQKKRDPKTKKLLPEYNWVWSNQTIINMHAPEKWGYLQFSDQTNVDQGIFEYPEDWQIKQVAYDLFLQAKYNKIKLVKDLKPFEKRTLSVIYGDNEPCEGQFIKTQLGFEIGLVHPTNQNIYLINEDGYLQIREPKKIAPKFIKSTWVHGGKVYVDSVWQKKLTLYQSMGISEILVGGSPSFLRDLIPEAKSYDIKVHAWMWTLNRPNDSTAMQHPEWYAVNRAGKNSLEYRAYVDYYQWLSPFHPGAREYIKNNVRELAEIDGLASIHLDYVRYVDVILGADLQPKYNLVQDHEMPEYDYGYHPLAREEFKKIFGYDPMDLKHPELSTEWRQFRLNAITSLVNELAEIAHQKGHRITAAVFPFPEMSRQMVRQAWNDWGLDAAYPMLYHNFYRESVNWVGFSAEQGVRDVDFPIYGGLYVPAFENEKDLEKALQLLKEAGAGGVSIFTADGLSREQIKVLKQF